MKILSRYILKEFLGNLCLGLIIFTFVMILDHLFELIDLVLNKGIGIWMTLQLLFLLLPSSLSLTLPMSSLLAALLTFGRLSENNEITAIKASGLSAGDFVRAPLAAALVAVLFLIPFNTRWAPHAHSRFRQLYLQVLQRNPLVRIEEKTFFEIGDYHLYVEKKDKKTKEMKGIEIIQTPPDGAPLRILADHGEATVDPVRGMTFNLHDGTIAQIDPTHPDQWFYTGFQTYVLSIPFQQQTQTSSRSLEEMDNGELQTEIRQRHRQGLPYPLFTVEKQLRWALAMTPFLFVMLGIPLAIRVHRGGRSIGFGISLVVLVVYYTLVMGGTGAGQRGLWPPWLAVWLGNVVMTALAVGLGWRFLRQ